MRRSWRSATRRCRRLAGLGLAIAITAGCAQSGEREVGLSAATVSKVFNGRSDVAPETRVRVEASLERHRYRRRTNRRPAGPRG